MFDWTYHCLIRANELRTSYNCVKIGDDSGVQCMIGFVKENMNITYDSRSWRSSTTQACTTKLKKKKTIKG